MLWMSYGQLFLLVGAAVAVIGPKDLQTMARTAGRLAGRSIGYVQLARGQFQSVMHQSQANQVHKELQDAMQQLEAIRHEVRSISFMNSAPFTRRLVDDPGLASADAGSNMPPNLDEDQKHPEPNSEGCLPTTSTTTYMHSQKITEPFSKGSIPVTSTATNLHSQATSYAKLAESQLKNDGLKSLESVVKPGDETVLFNILPVSAETAGLLPNRKDGPKGSDIMLEAVLEAEVAQNAKQFFAEHQNELKSLSNRNTKHRSHWN